jgi:hypothetical protein
MLDRAESIFRQFAAEYLREFETEFENILGFNQEPRASWFMKKTRGRETVSLSIFPLQTKHLLLFFKYEPSSFYIRFIL